MVPYSEPSLNRESCRLPQPLLIVHQSCPSKAWKKAGEDTQLWTPSPDPTSLT